MREENLKVYSIRLGEKEISRIDKLATTHFYWRRSGIILGILLAVLKAVPDWKIYNLVRYGYDASDFNIAITINKHDCSK